MAAVGARNAFDKRLRAISCATAPKQARPIAGPLRLLVIFYRLERVTDQAQEHLRGDHLRRDRRRPSSRRSTRSSSSTSGTTASSQLAAALARKAFPDSGHFDSAGWDAGATVDAALAQPSWTRTASSCEGRTPRGVMADHDALAALPRHRQPGRATRARASPSCPSTPCCSHWDVGSPGEDTPPTRDQLAALHRELATPPPRPDGCPARRGGRLSMAGAAHRAPAAAGPRPPRRRLVDRRGVSVLVFVGGISAIVFIVGIFVFITREGFGFITGTLRRRRVLRLHAAGGPPPSTTPPTAPWR